jgi:hypothetical protein
MQYVHESNDEVGEDDFEKIQTSMMIKLEEDPQALQNVKEIYFEDINNDINDDKDYFPNEADVLSDDDFVPDIHSDWEEKTIVRNPRRNVRMKIASPKVETLESSLTNDESHRKKVVKNKECDTCAILFAKSQDLVDHVNFVQLFVKIWLSIVV